MVSKRRSIKRQRRQRQQRGGEIYYEETQLRNILSLMNKTEKNKLLTNLKQILGDDIGDDISEIYFKRYDDDDKNNDKEKLIQTVIEEYKKKNQLWDKFIRVFIFMKTSFFYNTLNKVDDINVITLYDNIGTPKYFVKVVDEKDIPKKVVKVEKDGTKTMVNFINDNTSLEELNLKTTRVCVEDNQKKKVKWQESKVLKSESSCGNLDLFFDYIIRHKLLNTSTSSSKPQQQPFDVDDLNAILTDALSCVKIPYDKYNQDKYNIVIKNVVLSGPTTGGKSRRKISTRQIRDIIKNSIKFGGEGDETPPPQQDDEKEKLIQEEQKKQEEKEKLELEKQIQEEINNIIQNITLPNGLKIKSLEIKLEHKPRVVGSVGGKSTRRRRQTRMKTRKQYKSRN